MITGFNTDILHQGVTYHVQTEDKGLETPLILSLVYVGGAILASKRSLYKDLIEAGFDEQLLTERLQRQHKLICAAIRAGRIEDLKRMNERDASPVARAPAPVPPVAPAIVPPVAPAPTHDTVPAPPPVKTTDSPFVFGNEIYSDAFVEPSSPLATDDRPSEKEEEKEAVFGGTQQAPVTRMPSMAAAPPITESATSPVAPPDNVMAFPTIEQRASSVAEPPEDEEPDTYEEEIYLSLLDDEGDFRAGQLATIRIHVGRGQYGKSAVANAEVTIKVLGTTFRPLILNTKTDAEGLAVVRALLPRFTSGRAAIIIRASDGDDAAELRRIIHQS